MEDPFLEQLYKDNKLGIAVYSVPELALVKANSKYLSVLGNEKVSVNEAVYIEELLNKVIKSGETVTCEEYEHKNISQEISYCKLVLVPIYEGAFMQSIVIQAIDVTEKVVLMNNLKEKSTKLEQQNRKAEDFFTFMVHELRTPLTNISATLQLLDLVYNKEMTLNIKRYINNIKRSTYQQLRLVNNLLDISKVAEGNYLKVYKENYDVISVTKGIIESIKPFAEAKNIKLIFTANCEKKVFPLDEEKYERIMLNLLSNSIKFTNKGKSIEIGVASKDKRVRISIKDEGIGISADKQGVIFEKFGQVHSRKSIAEEGAGIGLYLTKLLVEAMNGKLTLTSEEGKGSTFTVELLEDNLKEYHAEMFPC